MASNGWPKKPRREPPRLEESALWDYALGALGRRAFSVGELHQRLVRKAAEPRDVDRVVARLKEYGYLNDERFAETFAQSRLDNRGLGQHRVLRDLRQRRVGSKVAEQAVLRTYADTDETSLAAEFVARKFRSKDLAVYLADPRNLASAYRKLRYAGFSSSASIRVLKRHSAQAEELEQMEESNEGAEDPKIH